MLNLLDLPQEILDHILEQLEPTVTIETPRLEPGCVEDAAGMSTVRRIHDDDWDPISRQDLGNVRLTCKDLLRCAQYKWKMNMALDLQGSTLLSYLSPPHEDWNRVQTIYVHPRMGRERLCRSEQDWQKDLVSMNIGFSSEEIEKLSCWLSESGDASKNAAAHLYLGLHMFLHAQYLEIIFPESFNFHCFSELVNLQASKNLCGASNLRVIHMVNKERTDAVQRLSDGGLLAFLMQIAPKSHRLELTGLDNEVLKSWSIPAHSRKIRWLTIGPLMRGSISGVGSLLGMCNGLVHLEIDVRVLISYHMRNFDETPTERSTAVQLLLPDIIRHAQTLEHLTILAAPGRGHALEPVSAWIKMMSRMRHLTIPDILIAASEDTASLPESLETLNITLNQPWGYYWDRSPWGNFLGGWLSDLAFSHPAKFREVRVQSEGHKWKSKALRELYMSASIELFVDRSSRWMADREMRTVKRSREWHLNRKILARVDR